MNQEEGKIRQPAVAGTFYPGSPVELTKQIASLFSETEKPSFGGRPMALIAPHAGYMYSGATAAKAFKLLEGEQFDTVIVVSPSHTVFFQGSSVFDGDGYQTPLGLIEIDKELSEKLGSINPGVYLSDTGHAAKGSRGEHALEVQLPFLQVALGKFRLVAVIMGDQEPSTARALGEALAATIRGTNSLLVASTDLSHFHSEKEARNLDGAIREAIESYDPEQLLETLESGRGEACGGGPVAAVMLATRRLGGEAVRALEYTTSGAVTGDFSEVVGYLSAAILAPSADSGKKVLLGAKPARPARREDYILSDADKQQLKHIARSAIRARLDDKKYAPEPNENLSAEKGLFVTLTIDGQLRGCIGMIKARMPLYEAVASMAIEAAFDDPRFPVLTEEEFNDIEIEISILSPLQRVQSFSEIKVGVHGLMIKLDMHSGLLLPQVATDYGWTKAVFLEQLCLKAGLPIKSYQDKFAELYKFTAEVF